MSQNLKDISVVIPTLNCRYLLEPVIEKLREIVALTGEVIVVDSYSEDGSLEFLRERLGHPNIQFHTRPKGLYAAWNYGIDHCTKNWIYIATAGDIISAEDLRFLHSTAECSGVDVVCAPPVFIGENGDRCDDLKWPIFEILRDHPDRDLVCLSPLHLACLAVKLGRASKYYKGWLGSSASNIYRSEFLKENKFSTKVGRSGDTFWGITNSRRASVIFCRRRCGRFVIHRRSNSSKSGERQSIRNEYNNLFTETINWIHDESAQKEDVPALNALTEDFLATEEAMLLKLKHLKDKIAALRHSLKASREEISRAREKVPRVFHRYVFTPDESKGREE